MKEILNDTKYGEVKNVLIEKEFNGWNCSNKKSKTVKENFQNPPQRDENESKEIDPIKQENLQDLSGGALETPVKEKPQVSGNPVIKSNHNLKCSDLTSKKNTQLANQMKSIINHENPTEKKFTHRRTASEGASKKVYDSNFHVFVESEKTKLQKLNESGKFYFYGEKRDALFESAKKKAEEKEKYVDNLIQGYNFSSDFKKKATDYLNRLDE